MPTKYPRLNVVFEPKLYETIRALAQEDTISMSQKVRDLVQEALEDQEDLALATLADERMRTFQPTKALSHEQIWAHLKKSKRS